MGTMQDPAMILDYRNLKDKIHEKAEHTELRSEFYVKFPVLRVN